MIEIVARNGPPEAMNCAALICDACRRQVVGEGNILWTVRYVGEQRESSPLFVSHKGCCYLVEARLEASYPDTDGWSGSLSEEAEDFIRHLAHNLQHAFADDPDGTYLDHTLVHPTVRPA